LRDTERAGRLPRLLATKEVDVSTAASSFFRCRLCGHTQYSPVRTRSPGGAWEHTGHWKCMGCSVMFVDPKAFSSQSTPSETDSEPAAIGSAASV